MQQLPPVPVNVWVENIFYLLHPAVATSSRSCKNLATPFGEPTCITVSTGRKSTPRSRLAVHTTAFNLPVCKALQPIILIPVQSSMM